MQQYTLRVCWLPAIQVHAGGVIPDMRECFSSGRGWCRSLSLPSKILAVLTCTDMVLTRPLFYMYTTLSRSEHIAFFLYVHTLSCSEHMHAQCSYSVLFSIADSSSSQTHVYNFLDKQWFQLVDLAIVCLPCFSLLQRQLCFFLAGRL